MKYDRHGTLWKIRNNYFSKDEKQKEKTNGVNW